MDDNGDSNGAGASHPINYSSAVLLVSENSILERTIRQTLASQGHRIDTASGVEAIREKSKYAFDAVIVDSSQQIQEEDDTTSIVAQLNTPPVRLLNFFKSADPHLPVVFVQKARIGRKNADILQALMNRGANGFYTLNDLAETNVEMRNDFLARLRRLIAARTEDQRRIAGVIGTDLTDYERQAQWRGEFPQELGSLVVYTFRRNRRVEEGKQRGMAWYVDEAIQGACAPVKPSLHYAPKSKTVYLKEHQSRSETEEAISDSMLLKQEMPDRSITEPIGYYQTLEGTAVMAWTFFIAMTGGHLQKTLTEANTATLNLSDEQKRIAREIATLDNKIHLDNIIDWHEHTKGLTRPEDIQRAAQRYALHLNAIPPAMQTYTNAPSLGEAKERFYRAAAFSIMTEPWQLSLFSTVMDSFDENYGYAMGIQRPGAEEIIRHYAPEGQANESLMRDEYANWDYKPLGTRGTIWVDVFHELDSPRRSLSDAEKLQHVRDVLTKLQGGDLDLLSPHLWDVLRAAGYKAARKAYVYLGHMQKTLLIGARHENLDDEAVANIAKGAEKVFDHYIRQAETWWTTSAAFYGQRGHTLPHFDGQITLLGQILGDHDAARSSLLEASPQNLPPQEQLRVMRLKTLAEAYGKWSQTYRAVNTEALRRDGLANRLISI